MKLEAFWTSHHVDW